MPRFFMRFSALLSVILLICIVFMFGYVGNLKANISDNLLRLHIVGESNSTYDQLLKLCVRDRILKDFSSELDGSASALEASLRAENLLCEIEKSAEDELMKNGHSATVSARIEECHFPTKSYGNISLPGGKYTALNIKIGKAEGRNWWCVMYPPLCLTNKSLVMPSSSEELLKSNLSDEEYRLITEASSPDIKIKFRIAEILGKYFS